MNVLHVSPSYYPATFWGGPIHSVRGLNDALAEHPGVHIEILTTDAAGPRVTERTRVVRPADYPNQHVVMARRIAGASVSPGLLGHLPSLVSWADVVHVTAAYSFPTLPTLTLARALGKPLVWSPRGAILDAHVWTGARKRELKRVWNRTCNVLLDRALSRVHVTSNAEEQATRVQVPRAQTALIPNGVSIPPAFAAKRWRPDGTLRLIFMGRISEKKGLERLLDAMALVRGDKIHLRIYGTGEADYVARVEDHARNLGLGDDAVEFCGHVDGADKARAFELADLCVVPSYTENFCMVVAEALAHGVPVIASTGTPWQGVEEHGCGLWIDAEPPALVAAFRRMATFDLARMGAQGRDWMEREYSWSSVAARMLDVYTALVAEARTSS